MPFDELQAELIDEVGVMAVALFLGMITCSNPWTPLSCAIFLFTILPLAKLSANLIPHDHNYLPKTE